MTGPSITSWNRLEPRPRTDSIARSLAAEIRDPLWFLTRQWQFGEFQGEDAASPAWVQLKARFSKFDSWGAPGVAAHDFNERVAPLEALVEHEPFILDQATAVELGQRFELLLSRAFDASGAEPEPALADLIQAFRGEYPLDPLSARTADRQTVWFLRVCAGRAINGSLLYEATGNADLPDAPAVAAALQDVVRQAVQRWREWVRDVYGELSMADAPSATAASTWQADRLEYGVEVSATTPDGGRARFHADPGREGAFDWYAFDEKAFDPTGGGRTKEVVRSLLPIQVRFRGMPHARWWQFQDRIADLGEVQPELRELAKLVLMDFMFVHSNDWFVVPFTQDVGTLCRIDHLLVHDVFGGKTLINRADREGINDEDQTRRWSMFAITAPNAEGGLADYFVLPPSAASAALSSEPLESVRFVRDEMANMVWAIEHTTENGIGMPWLGHERAVAGRTDETVTAEAPTAPLKYQIQNMVPEHWIPFLPVQIDSSGQVALERSGMLGPVDAQTGQRQRVRPVGRILNPGDPYRLREEEVPRTGVTVSRIVRRSRWIDGSTHLWIARRKQSGAGEGSSGLYFDLADPVSPSGNA